MALGAPSVSASLLSLIALPTIAAPGWDGRDVLNAKDMHEVPVL